MAWTRKGWCISAGCLCMYKGYSGGKWTHGRGKAYYQQWTVQISQTEIANVCLRLVPKILQQGNIIILNWMEYILHYPTIFVNLEFF